MKHEDPCHSDDYYKQLQLKRQNWHHNHNSSHDAIYDHLHHGSLHRSNVYNQPQNNIFQVNKPYYHPTNLDFLKIHDNIQINDYVVSPITTQWGPESMELFNKICNFFDYDNKEYAEMPTSARVQAAFYVLCQNLLAQSVYCYVIDKTSNPIKYKLATEHDRLVITAAFEEIMMLYLSNDKYFESNKHTEIIQTWNAIYPELSINLS